MMDVGSTTIVMNSYGWVDDFKWVKHVLFHACDLLHMHITCTCTLTWSSTGLFIYTHSEEECEAMHTMSWRSDWLVLDRERQRSFVDQRCIVFWVDTMAGVITNWLVLNGQLVLTAHHPLSHCLEALIEDGQCKAKHHCSNYIWHESTHVIGEIWRMWIRIRLCMILQLSL